ncbi:recombinase RecT [Paenibacillus herberti]|uniref:Recombinase RecT n=1 Tax=Paenibacillus herberti TaxID=1619309 RepID=A0A229P501_9BACL|nr:recombinase RecT [Paenibacillus herberti]OXM17343.1 recombinase RecT [Paenibacillus herberti]
MAGTSRSTQELGNKLQNRAQQSGENKPAVTPAQTIGAYMEKMKGQIAEALPRHMSIERLSRIALTTIRTNPKLLECTTASLMGAVMQSAQLGLEPGLIGHCYIIPYGKEAQFIIGYKGMIDLARRSGHIQSIAAHVVYQNDFIELVYGLDDKLTHVPWHLRSDAFPTESGAIKGAYMVAKFKDGGHQIHYMPYSEILQHRDRSSGYKNAVKYNKTDNPWISDEPEMCKKTVIRSGWKFLPISVEISAAVTRDESVHADISTAAGDDMIIDLGKNDYSSEEENAGEMEFNGAAAGV